MLAVIFATIAIVFLACWVRDTKREKDFFLSEVIREYTSKQQVFTFSTKYCNIIILSFLYALGNLNISFLILVAKQKNVEVNIFPIVVILTNLSCLLGTFITGILSDKINEFYILLISFIVLVLANIILGFSASLNMIFMGIIFMGFQLGINQSNFLTLIAKCSASNIKAISFGIFYFSNGVASILTAIITGFIWDIYSAKTALIFNISIITLGMLLLVFYSISRNNTLKLL